MRWTRRLVNLELDALVATDGPLDPAATFIVPYIAKLSAGEPVTAADFTLPDATDCPAQALTSWGAVQVLGDGRSCRQAAAKTFRLPDADNAFSAAGWALMDAATAGNVLGYRALSTPVNLADETKPLTVVVRVAKGLDQGAEASVEING